MTEFASAWHLRLGLLGLAVGSSVALASHRMRRDDRRLALAVVAALAALAVLDNLHWWGPAVLAGCGVTGLSIVVILRDLDVPETTAFGWLGPAFIGGSLVGVWATVPDTEGPLIAATAMAPILALLMLSRRSLGRAAQASCVGLLIITAATGTAGRSEAVAGAVCCLCWPVVGLGLPGDPSSEPGLRRTGWLLVAHAATVVVGSRFVAHRHGPVAWVTAGFAVLSALVVALASRQRPLAPVAAGPEP